MWLASDIASWRGLPTFHRTKGGVFPEEGYYRPSTKTIRWGRFIFTYEAPLYEYDSMVEGTQTIVNGHPCQVKHWTFPKVSIWYFLFAFFVLNWIPGGTARAEARLRRQRDVRHP